MDLILNVSAVYWRITNFLLLTLMFLVSPIAAANVVLPNGGLVSASIASAGEIDSYTFTGNAGNSVYLRVAETDSNTIVSSPFSPRVELRGPNGGLITGNTGALVGAVFVQLTVAGEYTVAIRDDSSTEANTGSYNLYFASVPGANENEGGSLVNGGSVSDQIDRGDIDTYAFSATAGDYVYLRAADTETTNFVNAPFSPRVALFDPNGNVVTGDTGALVGALQTQLVITGTYTVVVRDDSSTDANVGTYDLYYALIPGADENEGGVLVNDQSVSDRIDLGDLDTYTFFAQAGESVYLRVGETESNQFVTSPFSPRVALIDPSGNLLTGDTGALVAAIFSNLVTTGEYTVVVRDDSSSDANVGTYDLYYTKVPGANEGGGISGGQSIDEFIDLGDIDSYAFTANSLGASVSFTVSDLGPTGLSPRVALFDPSGNLVAGDTGALVASINAVLTMNGVYTLVVRDDSSSDANIGNYRLTGVGAFTGIPAAAKTCNGQVVTVDLALNQFPTSGDDVIAGTSGADVIVAGLGNDIICGLAGNDTINAGPGDDWVDAGSGNDEVFGLDGADIVLGGAGADTVIGGNGNDLIIGGGSGDVLNGGPGDDMVFGGAGNDDIFGQGGNDLLFGGDGDDFVIGVGGTDEIHGENGDDVLNGGPGNDTLYGGDGEDTIFGLTGNDTIDGGLSDDRVFGQLGSDIITGGGGNDLLSGNEGNDVITASSGSNVINGGPGDDTLTGGSGPDQIFGDGDISQAGNDVIDGGAGSDVLLGFAGTDTITSDDGTNDTVNGGPGTDVCTADNIDTTFNCP